MRVYCTKSHILLENDTGGKLCYSKLDGKCEDYLASEVIPDATLCGSADLFLGSLSCDDVAYLFFATSVSAVGHFASEKDTFPINRINRVKAVSVCSDARVIKEVLDELAPSSRLKLGSEKLMKFVQDKLGSSNSLVDETLRLFNDHPDFYYCFERDITRSTEKYFSGLSSPDDRFFWNKQMLSSVFDSKLDDSTKNTWCVPIIQGFVTSVELSLHEDPIIPAVLNLTLISRRSVHRAGARYLRRGADCTGHVANFVETELLLNIFNHQLSFIQIRGSVPVFWSQKGFKYRPPLTIDKSIEESLPVCLEHFNDVLNNYGSPIVVLNLVDHTGRELKLAESYLEHCLKMDTENVKYISYDLHQHCKGLRFDKISALITNLEEDLTSVGYCWVDKTGEVVRRQSGIVRTNCVDCLDRTNVVQGAISQFVCMQQAQRLGIFGPLTSPPDALVNVLQTMWADNGDAISTQYAGTAALKGDVTRSGERRFTGIMKDGYNSASRYYLSHVRDTARQRAINFLLGVPDQGSESMTESSELDEEEDESVARLVYETVHFVIPDGDILVGGWGLIDSRGDQDDSVDSVILLTRSHLYIACYDEEAEKLLGVKIIPLDDIVALELGRQSRNGRLHLKVTCNRNCQESWAWRASKTRLFNRVAIRLKTQAEADEFLESVAEQISVTAGMFTGSDLKIDYPQRIVISGRETAAKKMISSVTSALRLRGKRNANNSKADLSQICTPDNNAGDSGMGTPVEDLPCDEREMDNVRTGFRDDTNIASNDTLEVMTEFRSSTSDSRLSDRSFGLMSKIRSLRGTAQHNQVEGAPSLGTFGRIVNSMPLSGTKLLFL